MREAWITYLRQVEFIRNYPTFYAVQAMGRSRRHPFLEKALPGLLLLHLVSLLDEGLERKMEDEGWTLPPKQKDDLYNRLRFLNGKGALIAFDSLEKLREQRNRVAHEGLELPWAVMDEGIDAVQAQLEAWGFVGIKPVYSVQMERAPVDAPSDPKIAFGFRYRVELIEAGQCVMRSEWHEWIHRVTNDPPAD